MIIKFIALYIIGFIYTVYKHDLLLWRRFFSWICIGIIYSLALYFGNLGIIILITFIAIQGVRESIKISNLKPMYLILVYTFLGAAILVTISSKVTLALLASVLLLILFSMSYRARGISDQLVLALFICLWIIMPMVHLIPLSKLGTNNLILTYVVVATSLSDILAFVVGKFINTKIKNYHLISSKINPNKSWEGAIGNLLGSTLSTLLFYSDLKVYISTIHIIVITILITSTSIAGDFLESAFKRYFKTKDSGTILPGLGGILDRIDSLLITGVIIYYYLVIIAPIT